MIVYCFRNKFKDRRSVYYSVLNWVLSPWVCMHTWVISRPLLEVTNKNTSSPPQSWHWPGAPASIIFKACMSHLKAVLSTYLSGGMSLNNLVFSPYLDTNWAGILGQEFEVSVSVLSSDMIKKKKSFIVWHDWKSLGKYSLVSEHFTVLYCALQFSVSNIELTESFKI